MKGEDKIRNLLTKEMILVIESVRVLVCVWGGGGCVCLNDNSKNNELINLKL